MSATSSSLVKMVRSRVSTVLAFVAIVFLAASPALCSADTADAVVARVHVGFQPRGIGVNPVTNRVYVANDGVNWVNVIDAATNTVTALVPVGQRPGGVAVNPITNRIYVGNALDGTISVIDGGTDTVVDTIGVGAVPLVNPTSNRLYVSTGPSTHVLDAATHAVLNTIADFGANSVNEVTNRVYGFHPGGLAVVDGGTDTILAVVPTPQPFTATAVNPATDRIYVSDTQSVLVIDGTTHAVIATIPVSGSGPLGVNAGANRIYVSSHAPGTTSDPGFTVIDGASNTVVAAFALLDLGFGGGIEGVAVNQATSRVYMTLSSAFAQEVVVVAPVALAHLRATGPTGNPANLFLDGTPPGGTTARFKDSPGVALGGGNPWKVIGTWADAPGAASALTAIHDVRVWLGLKSSDDQGTRFDLRVEVQNNGVPQAAQEAYCIEGLTRNPSKAVEVSVPFALAPVNFADSDVLSVRLLARIGTDGGQGFCGGHSNATGLRTYFDAVTRDARLSATSSP